jgi:hypothetical protein
LEDHKDCAEDCIDNYVEKVNPIVFLIMTSILLLAGFSLGIVAAVMQSHLF